MGSLNSIFLISQLLIHLPSRKILKETQLNLRQQSFSFHVFRNADYADTPEIFATAIKIHLAESCFNRT